MAKPVLYTIGAYGFDEARFFSALVDAGIDTFVDIRRRRGVRGSEYAFANSARLTARLEQLGIRYHYEPDLAPGMETIQAQDAKGRATGVARRRRERLDPDFVAHYEATCLAGFDSVGFQARLPADAVHVVLFCVERHPEACHRSLVAKRLAENLKLEVHHLQPKD